MQKNPIYNALKSMYELMWQDAAWRSNKREELCPVWLCFCPAGLHGDRLNKVSGLSLHDEKWATRFNASLVPHGSPPEIDMKAQGHNKTHLAALKRLVFVPKVPALNISTSSNTFSPLKDAGDAERVHYKTGAFKATRTNTPDKHHVLLSRHANARF